MKIIRILFLFLLVLLAGAALWVYSGVYNVAADQPPAKFEDWLLDTVKHRSIEARAGDLPAPELTDPARIDRGFELFDTRCVTCHGAPGVWPEDFAMGLYPVPPRLSLPHIQEEGATELYWVVKNGIKLSGMPAFGPSLNEDDLWSVVAFVYHLSELDEAGYAALRASEAPAPAEAVGEGTQEPSEPPGDEAVAPGADAAASTSAP